MKPHLFAVVVLAACSARGPALTADQIDNIALLYGKPNCEYESMGTVTGGDGHTGVASGMIWGPRGTDQRALQELKAETAAKGADAVIVLQRSGGQRERPRGSLSKRAARRVEFTGTAIRSCEAEKKIVVHGRFDVDGNPVDPDS